MTDTSWSTTIKGPVVRPGSYQASGDDNLLTLIFREAGGLMSSRYLLKAVLLGGTLGHFVSPQDLKAPVRQAAEVMVVDDGSCLVNVVRLLLTYNLTCLPDYRGCSLCRSALAEALELLAALCSANGRPSHLSRLQGLSATNAACPDHCSALSPLKSALELYMPEFSKHATGSCPASICGELMLTPCSNSCPANVDLPGTIALMQMGKFHDALALGRHANPLFLTCGFVCEDPPCQINCKRLTFDDAIYSQSLHRYCGEKAAERAGTLAKALQHGSICPGTRTGKKVAIVGAGPAGLSAAYFLSRLGYQVTLYEKNATAGGMAASGIPAYRIDRSVLAAEIAAIEELGAKLIANCTVGRDIALEELRRDYDAVLVAIGAGQSRRLGLDGENLPGVIGAVEFLTEVASTGTTVIGSHVLVIGGGNVAIDAARTAVRLGAQTVELLCVEDKFEMPASRHEIVAAEAEGIIITGLALPISFEGMEQVSKMIYTAIEPGPYNAIGRRWPPQPLANCHGEKHCDMVIIAIGQMPDCASLSNALVKRGPYLAAENYTTNLSGVFTAGDCASPVNTVVKAIRDGKEAAFIIDEHFTGLRRTLDSELRSALGCFTGAYVCHTATQVAKREQNTVERIGNFSLVDLGMTPEQANYEMLRCICAAKGAL